MSGRGEMVYCPVCEGSGSVIDGRKVHSRCIEPPVVPCPECGGSGEVPEEDIEDIDPEATVADYERIARDEEADRRWRARREDGEL